jgi:hypothetical protein
MTDRNIFLWMYSGMLVVSFGLDAAGLSTQFGQFETWVVLTLLYLVIVIAVIAEQVVDDD